MGRVASIALAIIGITTLFFNPLIGVILLALAGIAYWIDRNEVYL